MYRNRQLARKLAIATALVASIVVAVPVTLASAPKEHDPDATALVDGGTTAAVDIKITNTSTGGNITANGIRVAIDQDIDTADIVSVTKPAGAAGVITPIANTLPSRYIEILSANIKQGASKAYTFTVNMKIPCGATDEVYDWVTDIRQSNDFNGTNNKIPAISPDPTPARTTVGTGCSLAFVTQPANAAPSTKITSAAFNESGSPVAVAIRNGAGGSVPWFAGTINLTSTPATTITGGSVAVTSGQNASYTNLRIAAAATYTLTASTTEAGVSPATSGSFKVGYGTTNSCTALDQKACSTGTIPGPTTGTSGAITVNDSDGLTADLSAEFFVGSIDCSGTGYEEFGDNLLFNVTNVTAGATSGLTKTVTLTKPIPTGRPSATGDEWRYQLCFQSKVTFKAVPTFGDAQANFDSLLRALSNGDYTDPAEEVSSGFVLASPADLLDPAYREYRGLLPRCSLVAEQAPCLGPIDPASILTPKARIPAVKFNGDGTVTFTASVPIGDPMGR